MSKFASKLLIGLSLFAIAAPAAQAQDPIANFFEQLFGTRQNRSQPQYRRQQQAPVAVQQQDQQDPPPPKRRRQPQQQAAVEQAPEDPPQGRRKGQTAADETAADVQLPGLGMGTLDYLPPLQQVVFDPTFGKEVAVAPESEAIRIILADKLSPIKAVEAEKKAVLAFYKAREFKPVWFDAGHFSPRANELLKTFAASADDGLVAQHYLPEVLQTFENAEQQVSNDAAKTARLDIGLTLMSLRYARHVSGGQFEPARLSLYNDIKPETVSADEALKALTEVQNPVDYLNGLAPKMPQYAVLKAELAKIGTGAMAPLEQIASGPTVKPGKSDPRIPAVRARLEMMGYIGQDAVNTDTKLDQDLAIALMALQTAGKLKPSGQLDATTLKLLNTDEKASHREKLIASMERLRWLPKNLGEKYVFVNQAGYDVHVMQNDVPIWVSRVVVGQPDKQTYSFYNNISTVVFNPRWGVPASIIVNEYGPKMREDLNYLSDNNFIVTDLNGDELNPRNIDWWHLGTTPNFNVIQSAGEGNALGELKFLFPNSHDIYMHDTPSKSLFEKSARAFSHGCVRVQNPREFAQVLLNWDEKQVEKGLASGDTKDVKLEKSVPVYLTYFTAWTDDQGKIAFHDDVYGRDAAVTKALAFDVKPVKITPVKDSSVQDTPANGVQN